jgi:hypothetical protein
MNRKAALIFLALVSLLLILITGPAYCEPRTAYLVACQQLVSTARGYEAQASAHGQIAKNLQMQIENVSKFPKSQGQALGIDTLFSQYDQNRALEQKYRELYREAADQAKSCMKAAE